MVSLYLGRGGDPQSAQLLEMSRSTVTHGRKQLLAGDVDKHRIRKPGGGRKPIEKKPRILMCYARYRGFRHCRRSYIGKLWYRSTTERVASDLNVLGYQISDRSVSRLLKSMAIRFGESQANITHPTS